MYASARSAAAPGRLPAVRAAGRLRTCARTGRRHASSNERDRGRWWSPRSLYNSVVGKDGNSEWQRRAVDRTADEGYYYPDSEWELIQSVRSIVRRATAPAEGTELVVEDTTEQDLAAAVTALVDGAGGVLRPEQVRALAQAWPLLYSARLAGSVASAVPETIGGGAAGPLSADVLRKALGQVAAYEEPSAVHLALARRVHSELARRVQGDARHEAFVLYLGTLLKNKQYAEVVSAFDQLLAGLPALTEAAAVHLVTIFNHLNDDQVQDGLVMRLFMKPRFESVAAFNVVLQAAIESGQKRVWKVYRKVLLAGNTRGSTALVPDRRPAAGALAPDLDTYELLLRHVVAQPDSNEARKFVRDAERVLLDGGAPTYDVLECEALYRSWLVAAMATANGELGGRLAALLRADADSLDAESWQTLAQWAAFADGVAGAAAGLDELVARGLPAGTDALNGVFNAGRLNPAHSPAERDAIYALYDERRVPVDANTVALRIRERIAAGDVAGAVAAFARGRAHGLVWDRGAQDVRAVFMLFDEMCRQQPFDGDTLLTFYVNVKPTLGRVDYATRLAMVRALLMNARMEDVRLLLIHEMGEDTKYPLEAFPELYDVLNRFVLETADYTHAWAAYACIQRHFVPPYDAYGPVMRRFCQIGYPEGALQLFRHLRKGTATPPDRDVFTLLFRQFARSGFVEGIDELMVCFKVDLNIDTDITLFNALLEARAASSHFTDVIQLWRQIQLAQGQSPDGLDRQPNAETFAVLLRASVVGGAGMAQQIWAQMDQYAVAPTAQHYQFYVQSLCFSGYYKRALKAVQEMELLPQPEPAADSAEKKLGREDVLESLYNWTFLRERKDDVELWALEAHPDEWTRLKKSGRLIDEYLDRDGNVIGRPDDQEKTPGGVSARLSRLLLR
ncbi:uncharacterized protein V1510DRAFT_403224 [Dipodascopsis tothii]|uniref:uncharacterized protein n=1 Tax=Dipodascopsis tothii TaxID=44089 RepID=UPI0034CF8127